MAELSIFIGGFFCGMVGIAFMVLVHNIGSMLREIEWHDARLENPSSESRSIKLLVRYVTEEMDLVVYYPEFKTYYPLHRRNNNQIDELAITHFAYLDQIKRTIPKFSESVLNEHCDAV